MSRKLFLSLVFIFIAVSFSVIAALGVAYSQYLNTKVEVTTELPVSIPFEQDLAQVGEADLKNHAEGIVLNTNSQLSENEVADLIFMREEEKLAHDVYVSLYDKWGLQIFLNISESELNHTDSIKTLITSYGLSDPYINEVGKFKNANLQSLYTQLVINGSNSVVAALNVGALIEDLDIVDLTNAMNRTENTSILSVYDNLQRGSRNHIRSFSQTLGRYGETYSPTYLTQEEYLQIITTGTESGSTSNSNSNGKGKN